MTRSKLIVLGLLTGCAAFVIVCYLIWRISWPKPGAYDKYTKEQLTDLAAPLRTDEEVKGRLAAEDGPVVIEAGDGRVTVFGAEPTFDPADAKVEQLRELWRKADPDKSFVAGEPTAFVTGFSLPVEDHGLEGLVYTLAREENVEIYTLKPKRERVAQHLIAGGFSEEQTALYMIMREYLRQKAKGRDPEPAKFVELFLRDMSRHPSLNRVIVNDAQFKKIWERDFGDAAGYREVDTPDDMPGYLGGAASRARRFSREHVVRTLVHCAENGGRAFVACGRELALCIEPALRAGLAAR